MERLVSPPQKARNTSPQVVESEGNTELAGGAVLRPALDCVDRVSSGSGEASSSSSKKNVERQDRVERVASTLGGSVCRVELEKRRKEEKNNTFKGETDSRGLQELAFIHGQSCTGAARLCMNRWAKMSGLGPGAINSGRILSWISAQVPSGNKSFLCPIMHCNKKFDNQYHLLGHFKKFDHSPCDPAVTLRGSPSSSFACIICNRRFPTSQQYADHCLARASENDGHERNYPPQHIQFFACPCCFLLFSLRDECQQHMLQENHFSHYFKMSNRTAIPLPLPFPAYAKDLLISLCKEVPFQVKCMSCHRAFRSQTELTAHFRTHCHNAGPIAVSEKTISQVAEVFKVKGFCQNCNELCVDDHHVSWHTCKTFHKVQVLTSMEQSVLIFCHTNINVSYLKKHRSLAESSPLKRSLATDDQGEVISKQKRYLEDKSRDTCCSHTVKMWMCECHLTFPSEELVEKHILSANRICHKCAACGKLAENASIFHSHMSQFHRGAHLADSLLCCQACNVDLQNRNDVMSHVIEFHGGHSYFCEKYVSENELVLSSDKLTDTFYSNSLEIENQPSTSKELSPPLSPMDLSEETSHQGKWKCCLCEEIFSSEDKVKQHCISLESHHFHRFSCGLCKVTFQKIKTLHRHCQNRHSNVVQIKYFCGFCGDLFFDTEEELLVHLEGFHSTDYIRVSETAGTPVKVFVTTEEGSRLNCGCQEKYVSKEERKADYEKCQKAMLAKGNLQFHCNSCLSTARSYSDILTHFAGHKSNIIKREWYFVRCGACNKRFSDLVGAHQHVHNKHCFSQKPKLDFGSPAEGRIFQFSASGSRVDKKPDKDKLSVATTAPCSKPISQKKPAAIKEEVLSQDNENLPDLSYLCTMTHIIMMDLDNWGGLFNQLPATLNQGTFIWGFQGGHGNWKQPVDCKMFSYLNTTGCFFLHPHCGTRKEAADFAICVHAGRLDECLPKHIPFTILSGDKGFLELENQLKMTQRTTRILDPHKIDSDMLCALLNSISDMAKENEEDSPMTTEPCFEGATIQGDEDMQL